MRARSITRGESCVFFLLIRQAACSGEEIKASNGSYLLLRTME